MRINVLEPNIDIKGIDQGKSYTKSLVAKFESPDLIIFTKTSICIYRRSILQ